MNAKTTKTSRKSPASATPAYVPPITYGTPRVATDGYAVYMDLAAPASVGYRAVNAAALRLAAACEDLAQIQDSWVVCHGDNGNGAWVKLELCSGDSVERARTCLSMAVLAVTSAKAL